MSKRIEKNAAPTVCKKCSAWGGYAVRPEDWRAANGDMRKFRCLTPPEGQIIKKRPDGKCWKTVLRGLQKEIKDLVPNGPPERLKHLTTEEVLERAEKLIGAAPDDITDLNNFGDACAESEAVSDDCDYGPTWCADALARGRESIAAGIAARKVIV